MVALCRPRPRQDEPSQRHDRRGVGLAGSTTTSVVVNTSPQTARYASSAELRARATNMLGTGGHTESSIAMVAGIVPHRHHHDSLL
jgi:hypothetical protein